MLKSMREGAKSPIMKAFLIFLAGGFALWGIGDITSGSFSGSKAVSAGDKSFSTQEAAVEFDRARRNLGAGISIGEALQTPLLNEVMGSLSRKVLFSAEAERLGLTVTRDMQTSAIRQERAFQDEFGEFTEGRFLQTLGQIGLSEAEYLDRLSETLERDQIVGAVAATAFYPINAATSLAKFQLAERQIRFVSFPVNAETVATPSDADLASWYAENSANFDAPILRQFDAIILDPVDLEDGIVLEEALVKDAFDRRRDEFITPETRLLSQMVFNTQDEADDALAALANSDFATVAADKLSWTADDIALGNIRETALDATLGAAAFAGNEGDVVGPIETAFGFHLIEIGAITPGGESSFEDVRPTLEARLKAEAALDAVYDKANALEDVLGSGSTLREAASEVGATVTSLPPVDVNGLTIDGLAPSNDLAADSNLLSIGWELEIGDISVLAETGEATFFVIQLQEETDAAPRTLSDVQERAIADYKLEQAVASARNDANEAQASATAFDGATTGTMKRSGAGLDHPAANLIAAKAFEINAGEMAVVETGEEAILLITDEAIAAPQTDVEELAKQLTNSFARTMQSDWTGALALQLSDDFDLTINSEAVRLLLVQAGN